VKEMTRVNKKKQKTKGKRKRKRNGRIEKET
jgi:hypothetical protein